MSEPNPRAVIGDNNPPVDPWEAVSAHVDDIYAEAGNFLDGSAVENDGQAKAIESLLDMLREAEKARSAAFKDEKTPHLEAARRVDAKWNPLRDRIARAVAGCRAALTPWRAEQDRIRREAEEAARREAEEKRRAAVVAMQAETTDLAAREAAEVALKEAKKSDEAANRMARRATGLRTSWIAEVVDLSAAIRHYWRRNPDAFAELVLKLATSDVKAGKRDIPGIKAVEQRTAI